MRYIITASLALVFFSCQKQDSQPQLISQLGFDISRVKAGNTIQTQAVSFNSVEEAKQYLAAFKARSFKGNIHAQPHFKVVDAVGLIEPVASIPPAPWEDQPPHDPDLGGLGNSFGVTISDWVLWTGYQVTFTWEKGANGSPAGVSNFGSSLIGVHLGSSWDHQNGSAYTVGNTIHYSVNGIQNYNILIEGIGTVFSQQVTIFGTYDTKTGDFTINEK